jgi:hypothetical protein
MSIIVSQQIYPKMFNLMNCVWHEYFCGLPSHKRKFALAFKLDYEFTVFELEEIEKSCCEITTLDDFYTLAMGPTEDEEQDQEYHSLSQKFRPELKEKLNHFLDEFFDSERDIESWVHTYSQTRVA